MRPFPLRAVGLAAMLAIGCTLVSATSPTSDSTPIPPKDAKAAATASNRFGFDLYARAGAGEGNRIFSPISASVALAMTSAGARGETLAQMSRVLHVTALTEGHRAFGELLHSFESSHAKEGDAGAEKPPELAVADRIWTQRDFTYRADFLKVLRDEYRISLGELDFRREAESARQTINGWVVEQTHGRITDLLAPGSLDKYTRLVLTNAVYFKGDWQFPFQSELTREEKFATPKGNGNARMMRQLQYLAHARLDDLQLVELPYAGSTLSMVVVLPDDDKGLVDAERRLGTRYDRWVAALAHKEVDLWLPLWTTRQTLELNAILKAMGMPLAFDENHSDFSGMTDEPTPTPGKFYISEVIQKAFVEVTEKGTEAAAATAVEMSIPASCCPPPPPPPVVFHADHPFLYVIRDRSTGAILFMGKIVDPRA